MQLKAALARPSYWLLLTTLHYTSHTSSPAAVTDKEVVVVLVLPGQEMSALPLYRVQAWLRCGPTTLAVAQCSN